jgi:mannose-6-phosphate isomerase-like protein (cupin superfamily)
VRECSTARTFSNQVTRNSVSISFTTISSTPAALSLRTRYDVSEGIYYVLDGYGTLILDDERNPLSPGSVSVVHASHSPGIENHSGAPLRLIVVGVKA